MADLIDDIIAARTRMRLDGREPQYLVLNDAQMFALRQVAVNRMGNRPDTDVERFLGMRVLPTSQVLDMGGDDGR